MKTAEKKAPCFPRFFIILLVPLLLYCGLLAGFLGYIPLKSNLHSIIIVGIIFFIFIFFIQHNAWYSYCNYQNKLNNIKKDVEEYLANQELEIAGTKKSIGTIEPFFDTFIKNLRNDNFSSIAPSIFPTLGILGTFVAIAISMPDFSVESQEALDKEITILLTGVGTAFYASIFGIFLSIWWVFFEKRGLSKIEKNIQTIKQEYNTKIWTKEEINILTIVQNKMHNENLIQKLEYIITPQFIQNMDAVAQSRIQTIQQLNNEQNRLEDSLFKKYESILKSFEENSQQQTHLMQEFENIQKLLNQVNMQSHSSMEDFTNFTKALKTEIYAVLSSFELVSRDLRSFGQDLIKYDSKESHKDEQR